MAEPSQNGGAKPVRILVINPNSNKSMTAGVDKLIAGLDYHTESTHISTYTAPSGTSSIDNLADAIASAQTVHSDFLSNPSLFDHDAFVVACYSPHHLVALLRALPALQHKPVIGIFEASISLSLNLLPLSIPPAVAALPSPGRAARTFTATKFGIVTTGAGWVGILTDGVNSYLGLPESRTSQSARFKGVASTGLTAEELHSTPAEEVRERMLTATRELVRDGDVGVVALGCAGMAGMEEWVREACVLELGSEAAALVRVVDGVKAAIAMADGEARDV